MKSVGLMMSLVLLFILIIQNGCNNRKDEPLPVVPDDSLHRVDTSGIRLEWSTVAGAMLVKVSAPTTGWVAVGYDPTPGMGMKDANIIIGYVLNDSAYFEDDYGSGPGSHASDVSGGGVDNCTAIDGHETAGRTELQLIIPLDSGDSFDRKLNVGETYKVILAYGEDNADNFTGYHKFRIVVDMKM